MSDKRWYRLYAEKNGYKINEENADTIHEGLEAKKEKFGARYCPCKLDNSQKNICPCVEFRTNGHCHCELFEDWAK
jgi:ferredoxin-thioredoxin reductase catalytic chain